MNCDLQLITNDYHTLSNCDIQLITNNDVAFICSDDDYYYTQGEIARIFQLCCKCKQLANCIINQVCC
jgi:hypothetical protein